MNSQVFTVRWMYALIVLVASSGMAFGQLRLIDGFERADEWEMITADGVRSELVQEEGVVRLDYDFSAGAGYVVLRKRVELDLDANYRFGLRYKGTGPDNTIELKLLDPSLENVWWSVERDYAFPREWEIKSIRRRHVSFAWGPDEGMGLKSLGAIEIAVTATKGGEGSVWLDELSYEPLPAVEPEPSKPVYVDHGGKRARVPLNGAVDWRAAENNKAEFVFDNPVEFSGMELSWGAGSQGEYIVSSSLDGVHFKEIANERILRPGSHALFLPESETQYIRLQVTQGNAHLTRIMFDPVARYSNMNAYASERARVAREGAYPKYYTALTPWTVIGIPDHFDEALVSETGQIEPRKSGYSIEPFILRDGVVHSWNDAVITQSLVDGGVPIPSVHWTVDDLRLDITAVASDIGSDQCVYAEYRVTNTGDTEADFSLALAARPFQVLPAAQFLNTIGGMVDAEHVRITDTEVQVDGQIVLVSQTSADRVMADSTVSLPLSEMMKDPSVWNSEQQISHGQFPAGAMRFDLHLSAGESSVIHVAMPMSDDVRSVPADGFPDAYEYELGRWRDILDRFDLIVPDSEQRLRDTVRANLAYILINADGAGIRPGSRSYERSWIRDGAMTSAALIAMGHQDEARAFIEWYSGFQYMDGKIPCVVDARGPDPVDENDAPGEYIFAIRNAALSDGGIDEAFARTMYPSVRNTVQYIDRMRSKRLTPEFTDASDPLIRASSGLMPESISHEGYAAKPMHSYWDDFWVYRGLQDAVFLAEQLGEHEDAKRFQSLADDFGRAITDSIMLATRSHGIEYVPGCVELGDFDATSTSIAFYPTAASELIDESLLYHTFERAWDSVEARIHGTDLWDGMTPYEVRTVGTFVRLGWVERAHVYLDWLMELQAPSGWKQWGEIAYRQDEPCRFVGDMPHTWVGSGAILSIVSLFAYEQGEQIILGAGIPSDWLDSEDPVGIQNLVTRFGVLSYQLNRSGDDLHLRIEPGCIPPGGFVLKARELLRNDGVVVIEPVSRAEHSALRPVVHVDDSEGGI